MTVRKRIKSLLPKPILKAVRSYRVKKETRESQNLTTREIFTKIYEEKTWGESSDQTQRFFSGNGSHQREIVVAYIGAVGTFLASLDRKPNLVDLGCGDFHVGSNLRESCENYIACDIVPGLIEFNKEKYRTLNVDFRVLDLAEDDLPKADVAIVRQVFQHLSNRLIGKALAKIATSYKYLILTEQIPASDNFVPNLDKPPGAGVRLAFDSGLDITKSPFSLKAKAERVICEIPEDEEFGGVIRTTLYQLS